VLNNKNIGAVVITSAAGKLKGIITDGDLRRLVLLEQQISGRKLDRVMTADPITITPDLLAADALSIMQRHEITILPVVDESGELRGILHLHDLLGKGEFRFLI